MRLNELKPPRGSKPKKKRVGRGEASGSGKTCGRGHKGQGSRSGGGKPPWFEGGQMRLVRRLPKRGFTNFARVEYDVVNVEKLNEFADDTVITPELLKDTGIIRKANSQIKILGDGKLTKSLTVRVHGFSKSAVAKIEAAGGKAEVIP